MLFEQNMVASLKPKMSEIITGKVIDKCKRASFITDDDVRNKTLRILWLETAIELNLAAMQISNDIVMEDEVSENLEDYSSIIEAASEAIAKEIAKKLISSIQTYPNKTLKC